MINLFKINKAYYTRIYILYSCYKEMSCAQIYQFTIILLINRIETQVLLLIHIILHYLIFHLLLNKKNSSVM